MTRLPAAFKAHNRTNLGGILELARDLITTSPGRCALATLLLLTSGVTEAFGLLMIIPLLQAVGLGDAGGNSIPGVEMVIQAAKSLGLTLNLPGVLVVFLTLAAIRSIAGWARGVLTTRLRLEFSDRIRGDLYASVAQASWKHLLGRRRSDIHHILTDSVGRVSNAAFQLLQLVTGATLAAVQFLIALTVSPTIAAVTMLAILSLAVASRPLLQRSYSLGQQLTQGGRVLRGYATDFLDGLKMVKKQNAEVVHVERFQRQITKVRNQQIAFTMLSTGTQSALQFIAAMALAALVWYAVDHARLTLSELTLLALVFARVIPTLLRLLQWTQNLVNSLPAYDEVTTARIELQDAVETIGTCHSLPVAISEGIRIQDIDFIYPGASNATLAQVSFHIPAKEIFAITGPSGSGKTTLADLLLGLLTPDRGDILADDVVLDSSNIKSWRLGTGYVTRAVPAA